MPFYMYSHLVNTRYKNISSLCRLKTLDFHSCCTLVKILDFNNSIKYIWYSPHKSKCLPLIGLGKIKFLCRCFKSLDLPMICLCPYFTGITSLVTFMHMYVSMSLRVQTDISSTKEGAGLLFML